MKRLLKGSVLSGFGVVSFNYLNSKYQLNFVNERLKINEKIPEIPEKTVIVIGAGLMGLSSCYYLLQEGYKVILVEKQENCAMGTSNKNGCCVVINKTEPWTHPHIMKNIFKSFFDKTTSMEIKPSFLMEKFSLRWFLEAFFAFGRYKQGEIYNFKLGRLSMQELDTYPESKLELDRYATGSIKIFEKEDFREDAINYFETAKKMSGCEYQIINGVKEMREIEPGVNPNSNKFIFACKDLIETNINTEKFCQNLLKKCQNQPNFVFKPNTSIKNWILNAEGDRILGLQSENEKIYGSDFVVAAGLFSKDVMWMLGIRLPLLAIKGYSITFDMPKDYSPWKHTFCTFKGSIYYSRLGEKYRAAGLAEISGINLNLREDKIKRIISETKDLFGEDITNITPWCGLRPVSSDDVPIISQIKPYKNLFVNTGQGSKGTTLSLGSGKLLSTLVTKKPIENINPYNYSINRFWFF